MLYSHVAFGIKQVAISKVDSVTSMETKQQALFYTLTNYITMPPHRYIKDLLVSLGICAPPDDTTLKARNRNILSGVAVSFILLAQAISYAIPMTQANYLESVLNSIADTLVTVYLLITLVTLFISRERLKEILSKLNQNYSQCNTALRF